MENKRKIVLLENIDLYPQHPQGEKLHVHLNKPLFIVAQMQIYLLLRI